MLELRELTARGAGAVSVLELRGDDIRSCLSSLTGRSALEVGQVFVTKLRLGGELLDEALVVVPDEDRVELHVHGSPPLMAELRELLLGELDARLWSLPANLEERAATLAGSAHSEAGARILLDQAEGALRRALEGVLGKDAETGRFELERLLAAGRRARFALEAARVVLAGPVNAGKSTLFNLLVGEERALTSDLEGTTRDVVRARGALGPWPVEWLDTAGERVVEAHAGATIERAGQALGREVLSRCDLGFWLTPVDAAQDFPGSVSLPEALRGTLVPLRTCADRATGDGAGEGERADAGAVISALTRPEEAVARVTECFEQALGLERPAWIAGRADPFEPAQLDALEGWISLGPEDRDVALSSWLDESR
jgi:tRNA modification GTPase